MSAATYLNGRIRQVFDAPSSKRPRWTVQDAHAVRDLLRDTKIASLHHPAAPVPLPPRGEQE